MQTFSLQPAMKNNTNAANTQWANIVKLPNILKNTPEITPLLLRGTFYPTTIVFLKTSEWAYFPFLWKLEKLKISENIHRIVATVCFLEDVRLRTA